MAPTDERKLRLLGLLRQNDMHGSLPTAHLDTSMPIPLEKPTAYDLLDRMEREGRIGHRDEATGERSLPIVRSWTLPRCYVALDG